MSSYKWPTIGLTVVFIAIIAWFRLQLGIHRYFDPDELMYMNWAYHVYAGSVPYRDFMMFAAPLYVYVLAPLYAFWHGIEPIQVARIVSWVISLTLAGTTGFAFWTFRKSWFALVAVALVLFLPLPSDKLLEIRPDNLSLVFFMTGLAFVFSRKAFAAGILFGLSLLTLQKTAILIGVATVMLFFTTPKKKFLSYVAGLAIMAGLFLLWAVSTGNPSVVLYSVTTLAQEHISQVARFNQLPLNFYFLPNSTYYGEAGISIGLLANHFLWVLAVIWAAAHIRKLPALLLVAACVQYIWLSPLKFPQYLLPASLFVAWLTTYALRLFFEKQTLAYLLLLGLLLFVFLRVNQPKLAWTNEATYQKITRLLTRIPKTEYVFDLEGRTIYYRYPYYACCLAIGQFDSILFHKYPTIRDALKSTKTKYVYQAEIPRIAALPKEDAEFIFTNYQPEENGELYVAKNW